MVEKFVACAVKECFERGGLDMYEFNGMVATSEVEGDRFEAMKRIHEEGELDLTEAYKLLDDCEVEGDRIIFPIEWDEFMELDPDDWM